VPWTFGRAAGNREGREIVSPGQSFGDALMFLDKPYIVFAQALSDAMPLHVAKHALLDERARDPEFTRRMISDLARRLHGLVRDMEAYTLHSGQSASSAISLQTSLTAPATASRWEVHLTPGKSVIASRLNMTPPSISRASCTTSRRAA
jgi:CRP-like cAMP-binding protein